MLTLSAPLTRIIHHGDTEDTENIRPFSGALFHHPPIETRAALTVRPRAGGGDGNGPGGVWLCGQIAVIGEGHEHRVPAHEIDPLERFRFSRLDSGEVFQDHAILPR